MKHLTATAFAGLMIFGAAEAATINANFQVPGTPFGFTDLQAYITVSSPGLNGDMAAGRIQLAGDHGFGEFAAFGVDIFQALRSSDYYETPVSLFNASITGNLDRLFTSVYAEVDTAREAAAFQVAIWEIIYDDGAGFDLSSGAFSASNNGEVEYWASTYLGGLSEASTGGYDLTFLFSQEGQDLVTASPRQEQSLNAASVPLPASGLMLLGGLGGAAALRRKARMG